MIEIDFEKAKSLLEGCIEERGAEFVYAREGASCLYVHGIKNIWNEKSEDYEDDYSEIRPGCMIGLALYKVGVPLESMTHGRNGLAVAELLGRYSESLGVKIDEDALNLMINVQDSQDSRVPWGLAYEAGLRGKIMRQKRDENGSLTGEFYEVPGYEG